MPAIFGMAAAAHVLCKLAGSAIVPEMLYQVQAPQYATLLRRLCEREDLVFGNVDGPAVDIDDVRVVYPLALCSVTLGCILAQHVRWHLHWLVLPSCRSLLL